MFANLKNWFSDFISEIKTDSFKRYLLLSLILLGLITLIYPSLKKVSIKKADSYQIHFFYHPNCSYCKKQKEFNEILQDNFPITIIPHDISQPSENKIFMEFIDKYGLDKNKIGVPATFFDKYHFIGFLNEETTGKQIINALEEWTGLKPKIQLRAKEIQKDKIQIPFFGEIDVYKYSLPALAVILGLIDGFNPCAMWVLAYLISLIISLNDRKKIWILVGSFVFASGILYFLFMTAWLNVFILMGYIRTLTILIALFALWIGINDLKSYITKEELVCKVGNAEDKKRTMGKIERIVHAPLGPATILGIIVLSFVVNSIEFACSSALPVIFTQVLIQNKLPLLEYYSYILLYVFFFMLDDLLIFGLTAFAISYTFSTKYARFCKLIGGIVLIFVGIYLIISNTI